MLRIFYMFVHLLINKCKNIGVLKKMHFKSDHFSIFFLVYSVCKINSLINCIYCNKLKSTIIIITY